VARGRDPYGTKWPEGKAIPTFTQDIVLRVPPAPAAEADRKLTTRDGTIGDRERARLEPRFVDLEAEPVATHQLVVREAPLQVLRDHVDVLEVALEQVVFVGSGRARGVVDAAR
jgi:hypothetical protein